MSEKFFEAESKNIGGIYLDSDSFYQIPNYQRSYKWIDDHIDKLWEDILDAYKSGNKQYFLGSIILVKNNNYWDVVDGQQRLTTLTILFKVIKDLFPSINEKRTDFSITINQIRDALYYNNNINIFKFKLNTHSNQQSDFESFINGLYEEYDKKPSRSNISKDNEPKYKFINTAYLFKEKLKSINNIEEIGNIINFIFNNIYVIKIKCYDKNSAIKMFSILNSTGLNLCNSDLIKSYLLEKISLKYEKDIELLKNKEQAFISDWNNIEEVIKRVDLTMDDMIVIYEYYILAKNPEKDTYYELTSKFKNIDSEKIVSELKKICDTYEKEIYSEKDIEIYSLFYLRWNIYWKSILITAKLCKYNDYTKLRKIILRFYYLYWISEMSISKIKQTSFNIIKWVKENKNIKEIEKEINIKIQKDNVIKIAVSNILNTDVYNTNWLKPLLLMIEYNETDIIGFVELDRNLHTEHILPKKYQEHSEWIKLFTKELADKYLNSIGNLTLLSGTKNIKASNDIFENKIDIYLGNGREKNNNKISAFRITQKIWEDFETGKCKEWNEQAIIKRKNYLCKKIEKILDIEIL